MKDHSVIFIEHSDYQKLHNKECSSNRYKLLTFIHQCKELPKRIYSSFLPPFFGKNSRKVYVDWIGPILATILLCFILNHGHSYKHPMAVLQTPPLISVGLYSILVPAFCYILTKIGKSDLEPLEIFSLLGYGYYGHIFTILTCYLIDRESSNWLFFTLFLFFGGLSGLRIVIILLLTIPKPAARLIVCSLVTIAHLLFLIFIHFAYMHRTFKYGKVP